MTLPPDLAAFLAVLLRGGFLTAQALLIGGLVFLLALARPFAAQGRAGGAEMVGQALQWVTRAGLALAAVAAISVLLGIWNLMETLELTFASAMGADFVFWELVAVGAALAAGLLAALPGAGRFPWLIVAAAVLVQFASIMSSHAAARIDARPFYFATGLFHHLGAAVWIGGIPYLLMGLNRVEGRADRMWVGLRFSHIAATGVALLVIGIALLVIGYIGSVEALVGTAYGAMAMTKGFLLAVLLLLGLSNALFVRSLASGGDPSLFGLRRFAEAEIGIGISVLFVAASLASQPPAIDQMLNRADVATIAEISDRVMPSWPRLISPSSDSLTKPGMDPTAASEALDKAWSEFNHNWAGIFVCVIALLAMVERSGKASWARHWPLIFLVMAAVLIVRSDPESWPLGPIGFFEVMKDPEVFQHRAVILLLVPFGLFEWAVRTVRLKKPWAAQCFPVLCAVGGLLLLAHSHTLTDVKQRFLIEISHLPMGAFGVLAGWARWLEIRSHGRIATVASWIWPLSFLMVGLLLLEYRES